MSVKIYAILFGILFLIVGILGLGFIPTLTPNGYLLKYFYIDTINSSLYILTGIIGLLVSFSAHASRVYFRFVGVIYLFLAALASMIGGDYLVYMRFNMPTNLFHLVVAAIALYLGFGKPRRSVKSESVKIEEDKL